MKYRICRFADSVEKLPIVQKAKDKGEQILVVYKMVDSTDDIVYAKLLANEVAKRNVAFRKAFVFDENDNLVWSVYPSNFGLHNEPGNGHLTSSQRIIT